MTLENLIRGIVGDMLRQIGVGRHATVSSVDPVNGLAKVSYDEEGTVSGWLPVAQPGAGNGSGAVCYPVVGTQVYVAADMGDIAHGVIQGAVHSTQQPPGKVTPYMGTEPQAIVPGEWTIIHSSGASFRLTVGGTELHGFLKVDGDITASGQVSDRNGAHGTLDVLRQAYDMHMHTQVQNGTGTSGLTTEPTP